MVSTENDEEKSVLIRKKKERIYIGMRKENKKKNSYFKPVVSRYFQTGGDRRIEFKDTNGEVQCPWLSFV